MTGVRDFKFRVAWEGHARPQRAQAMPSPVRDRATCLPDNTSPSSEVTKSLLGTRNRAPACPIGVAGRPKLLVEKQSQLAKEVIVSLDSEYF